MCGESCGNHRGLGDSHHRVQRHTLKLAPALVSGSHEGRGVIDVIGHNNALSGGHVEVAEKVALRERGQQEVLRVPALRNPAKRNIGGGFQEGLSTHLKVNISGVFPIVRRSRARVSAPRRRDLVAVFVIHSVSMPGPVKRG